MMEGFHCCSFLCLQLPTQNRKVEIKGLIIDIVLLSMELLGNLTQYDSGSLAG